MRSMIAELPGFFVGNRRCSGWSHLFLPDPPKNSATKTCPKWWAKFFYFLELEVHHPISIQNYQPFPERKNELFERVPVQEPEANVFLKAHGTHEIFGVWWQGLHWKTILFCSEMMGEMVVSIRVSNWKKSGMWAKSSAGALLDCETHVSAVSLGSLFLFKRAKSKRNHSWQYMAIIVHGERCHDRWCLMKCNANHVSGVSGGDWTLCKLCTRKWNTMTHNFWWYVYVYYIYIYTYIHTYMYIYIYIHTSEAGIARKVTAVP